MVGGAAKFRFSRVRRRVPILIETSAASPEALAARRPFRPQHDLGAAEWVGVDEVEAEAVGAGVIGLAAARASALAGR
jgi:hypothetical protein